MIPSRLLCVSLLGLACLFWSHHARAQDAAEDTGPAPADEAATDEPTLEETPIDRAVPSPSPAEAETASSAPAREDASPAIGESAVSPAAPPSDAAPSDSDVAGVSVSFIALSGGETPVDPAPPTITSGVPWLIELAMQTFAQYEVSFPDGADWFHEIDVPRTWLSTSFRVENAIGRVLLEGTRAGGDGSLIGVGGDSLVVRFREAWLGYRLLDMLEIRAGLIPQLTTPALTSLWGMRAVRAIGLRENELMQPADLGASVRFDFPEQFGFVGIAYLSGEGYRGRELNRGKTLEVTAQIHPLAFLPEARPLTLTLAYQNGSTGTGSARADRYVAGLAWADPRWGLGVEAAYVAGIEDRSDREGLSLDVWGRLEPIEHLLLGARYAHFFRNLSGSTAGDETGFFTGTVGTWIVEAIRVFLAFDARVAGDAARAEIPNFTGYALRLVFEGNLGARFEGAL
jgi:hypothetical protein